MIQSVRRPAATVLATSVSVVTSLVGALLTAIFLTLGQVAIEIYLGFSAARSIYGAAGALLALLLWIYYSAQVLFLCAVFTNVLARREAR